MGTDLATPRAIMRHQAIAAEPISLARRDLGSKSLIAAYVSLVLFMAVYCARPEDWIPGVGVIPFAKVTGILSILAFLFSLRQVRARLPKEVIYLAVLLLQLSLAALFSPVWRGGAVWTTFNFAKVLPIVVVMVLVLNTMSRLRSLILLQTICVAIISTVTIWKGHTSQGRLEGVLGGNYGNPNDLACQIAICVPFCIAFFLRARRPTSKLAWGIVIGLMTYAVFVTGSRGGFLAWALAMAVCIWEFAIKGRYRYLLVIGVVGLLFLGLFGGQVVQRLEAISNEQGDALAYSSAQARRDLLWQSLKITARYPLFGIGAGNFPIVSGMWHVTHNSYTEMSAEGGIPALILYLAILWRAVFNIRNVKRKRDRPSERILWAKALEASLLAFFLASFFSSSSDQYFPYFLVAYTSALFAISRGKCLSKTESAPDDNSNPPAEMLGERAEAEPQCFSGRGAPFDSSTPIVSASLAACHA
jgi:putative inorganic carbon (hco3(-)) transporter